MSVEILREYMDEGDRLRKELRERLQKIVDISGAIADAILHGGKVLICGNGGSAADSQHMAAEFIVRLSSACKRRALPAIALSTDTSVLTAAANDLGYESVFSRQVEGLGNKGDILIGISTSGKSPNVLRALSVARRRGLTTIGLLGGTGGPAVRSCDMYYLVGSSDPCRVQEIHELIIHMVAALVEKSIVEEE